VLVRRRLVAELLVELGQLLNQPRPLARLAGDLQELAKDALQIVAALGPRVQAGERLQRRPIAGPLGDDLLVGRGGLLGGGQRVALHAGQAQQQRPPLLAHLGGRRGTRRRAELGKGAIEQRRLLGVAAGLAVVAL